MPDSPSPVWQLPDHRKKETAMWQFSAITQDRHGAAPEDYAALHQWSIEHPEAFYEALWDFLDIPGDRSGNEGQWSNSIRSPVFYPDARLNYAENLLRDPDERLAVIAHRDDGTKRTLTRQALYAQVSQLVQALRSLGVTEGDRVAAIITNDIEAIVGYLATSAIGAIWASCSPDFGPTGAADRLCQVDPKILIANPHYRYGNRSVDTTTSIAAVAEGCRVEKIILIGDSADPKLADLPTVFWNELLGSHDASSIDFIRLPYEAPLAILFTSGTTGKPKCIVHSAMGLLIQHMKEHTLHCDIRPGDRLLYFTTCGWMMWNWQVSALAIGATLVTYEGNPFYPGPERLLDIADEDNIHFFGTSAKYLQACQNRGLSPLHSHALESLRMMLSTGSPLLPESFDYVYTHWKTDVHLASISGGTDICGCFLGGNPLLPVHSGELQCALLGMAVDIYDSGGNPVTAGVKGELVCTRAHLSMPLGFWGDDDRTRFEAAYLSRFADVWAHGDYVEKTRHGGYIIHGRSDTTLNPGGVRIGTAEIYRLVETFEDIEEAVVVGQEWQGDQRIVLFIKLKNGLTLDEDRIRLIRDHIRAEATPRHVPARVIAVDDIPRTRSGKVSELAVRETIHGRPVTNTTALANPECLAAFAALDTLST